MSYNLDDIFIAFSKLTNTALTEAKETVLNTLDTIKKELDKESTANEKECSEKEESFIDRMEREYKELVLRTIKLDEYLELCKGQYSAYDTPDELFDKDIQLNAMRIYLKVLKRRIDRANGSINK